MKKTALFNMTSCALMAALMCVLLAVLSAYLPWSF